MSGLPFSTLPLPKRWAARGAVLAGLVGGIVGLVLGLRVHPGTAWFAIFELGIPSSILGGLVGVVLGAVAYAVGRFATPRR